MNRPSKSPNDKSVLRQQASYARASLDNKDGLSRAIFARIEKIPEYLQAKVVLYYVDVRDEVRTAWFLPEVLAGGEVTVVVPYCVGDELQLFRLEGMGQLSQGAFGILEPRAELRSVPAFHVSPKEIDLALVPGVAFDPSGGRLGHGHGYYDRLLATLTPETTKIGLAFDCQIVEQVPVDLHDIAMDVVVTESREMRR